MHISNRVARWARGRTRFTTIAGVLLALVLASVATAARERNAVDQYGPRLSLTASAGIGAPMGLKLALTGLSDGGMTRSVVIYVPQGYRIDTTLPAGTRIGRGSLYGEPVEVVDSALLNVRPACVEGGHAAVWRFGFLEDRTVFITIDATAGEETALGAYRLHLCSTGSSLGIHGVVQFWVTGVLSAPSSSGEYLWRAIFEPTPDSSGERLATESRVRVTLPVAVTLRTELDETRWVDQRGRHWRRGVVFLSGRVTEAGRPVKASMEFFRAPTATQLRLALSAGPDLRGFIVFRGRGLGYVGIVPTDAEGRFDDVYSRDLRGRYYRAQAVLHGSVPRALPELCGGPSPAAGGCTSGSRWTFIAFSPIVLARP